MDTREVDKWLGVPLGGGQFHDDIHVNDIGRWAQGMQNPNPLHFDRSFAAESVFGRVVAPQSFTVNCTVGHGAVPAIQGYIDGTHMLFGGDEWWFSGPRVFAGDKIRSERMLYDYVVKQTKFAGPTMFSRGDTTYINQRGEVIGKQRSTSIRYFAEEAARRADGYGEAREDPVWSDEELADLEKRKLEYYRSFLDLEHEKRLFVEVGEKLPTRPIGPHTVMSFTTEWRSYSMNVWGATYEEGASSTHQAGWLPEMSRDEEGGKIDPANIDGLYKGPSRGHVQPRYARLIGMPRSYGYGATMGAWILDYLANWAGEHGFVIHSDMKYTGPAHTGDATFIDAEVTAVEHDSTRGPVATLAVRMTTQTGATMASGQAEVQLPSP
ncbi:MAG: MaoC family dehydratase N-terminal domain-containing protein [Proteobacteria bacterium]|nr:MaoC family dehydratase N-terminal domain-containing protein [Pseudomonadota bacterium]